MFWVFMFAGLLVLLAWARFIRLNDETREYASGLRLVYRAGCLRGEMEFWRDEDCPKGGVFDHVQGVDRDVLVQFHRGRREGWVAAASEDLRDELVAVEQGTRIEDL